MPDHPHLYHLKESQELCPSLPQLTPYPTQYCLYSPKTILICLFATFLQFNETSMITEYCLFYLLLYTQSQKLCLDHSMLKFILSK